MNAHVRHTFLAIIVAMIALVLASVSARAQDFSSSTGAQLYKRFCSSCHGDRAHGDGTVAKSFKIEVPDLTRIAHRHGGVFPAEQIRKIIDGRKTLPPHGSREMPVWGFEFYQENENAGYPDPQRRADDLIARLTEFLRTIQIE
jgi:mono/diheme cytochrome c family protein